MLLSDYAVAIGKDRMAGEFFNSVISAWSTSTKSIEDKQAMAEFLRGEGFHICGYCLHLSDKPYCSKRCRKCFLNRKNYLERKQR